jgi:predicted GTPase
MTMESQEEPIDRARVLILGAAGRDFHNFNMLYRDDPGTEVVAFTAQQIPNIAGRRYPATLAGAHYPEGIPIHPESELEELIRFFGIGTCIMAYSDISHEEVMHLASRANAAGADFALIAPHRTMIAAGCPVVAVCASRTGAGKSQTTRAIVRHLRGEGLRVGVLRHPMPYGDLARQDVQRFAGEWDLRRHEVTIEEREEYEPHIAAGSVVFAGVDYESIVRRAESESDVLVWDGGNNDASFLAADLYITVLDPHRAGDELRYHPGETNLRLADVLLINKVDTASGDAVRRVRENAERVNPTARIIEAASPILADDTEVLAGRRVIAVEDGPTVTHGGMHYGAATIAAREAGAQLVDPREFAVGEVARTYEAYPDVGPLLPAMGYGERQILDLESTIDRAAKGGVEALAIGTPIDLSNLMDIPIPWTRVRYELEPIESGVLPDLLSDIITSARAGGTMPSADRTEDR